MDSKTLKSGSDIRGIAIGEGAVFTADVARQLGAAFAFYIAHSKRSDPGNVSIAVGRDSRISGPAILQAVCEGVTRTGAKAFDCGMCTTPSMYQTIVASDFHPTASIMITASHHPWNINGMKFFTESGGLGYSDLDEVLRIANAEIPLCETPGAFETIPYIPMYGASLAAMICNGLPGGNETPLAGLHVVVDAGNGAGGFYAQMLQSLGARTDGSQYLNPDGTFPNHPPNPENPEAMDSLSHAVIGAGADLGVIFDADCDRAAIVDSAGREINRNRLIALISAILLEKHPRATIVTDSVTSSGLSSFVKALGGCHHRFKRGYRNVIDEAIRLNNAGIDCPLAIETSGHAAMRENRFLDDGMYLVTYLIIRAVQLKARNQSLSSLIADLREPVESAEYRLKILTADFRKTGQDTIAVLLSQAEKIAGWHIAPDNREGVRISFDLDGGLDNGWFLLRLSVHDPVMPLNVESDVAGGNLTILRQLYTMLQHIPGLDLSSVSSLL